MKILYNVFISFQVSFFYLCLTYQCINHNSFTSNGIFLDPTKAIRWQKTKANKILIVLKWSSTVCWILAWTISCQCIVDEGVFSNLAIIITIFLHVFYGLLNCYISALNNEFIISQCLICWYAHKPKLLFYLFIAFDKGDNSHLCKWIFCYSERFYQHYACKVLKYYEFFSL